jgi:hypothetical protein
MLVRDGTTSFNRLRGSGPRTTRSEVVFSGPVTQATAIVRGFDVAFSPRHDHHLGQLEVRLEATIDPWLLSASTSTSPTGSATGPTSGTTTTRGKFTSP